MLVQYGVLKSSVAPLRSSGTTVCTDGPWQRHKRKRILMVHGKGTNVNVPLVECGVLAGIISHSVWSTEIGDFFIG